MNDIYPNIDKYNLIERTKKMVIALDDLIEYMIINIKFKPAVTELFILDIRFHHTVIPCCFRTYQVKLYFITKIQSKM